MSALKYIFVVEYLIPKLSSKKRQFEGKLDNNEVLLENADIYSKITLSWMNPLIVASSKANLSSESLPDIDRDYNTAHNSGLFKSHWAARRDDRTNSLVWALFKCFGLTISVSAFYNCLADILSFADPFLLRSLILFASSYLSPENPQPIVIGFYIALGMFVCAIVRTILSTYTQLNLIRLLWE